MKKTGIILLAVILALGTMGAAYAAWTQNLNITGTVHTGTYIIDVTETSAVLSSPTAYYGGSVYSGTTAVFSPGVVTVSGSGAGISGITIQNGFPGLSYAIPYTITNNGTVPARINNVKLTINNGATVINLWTGSSANIMLSGGSTTDVTIQNTSDGTINLDLLNPSLILSPGGPGQSVSGILLITIPFGLTVDTGGLNSGLSETFNLEIDTVQAP
jgi:predicted ribosomally synthesized peptide with SipW-like signal peptide